MKKRNLSWLAAVSTIFLLGCAQDLPEPARNAANSVATPNTLPLSVATTVVNLPVTMNYQIAPGGGRPPYTYTVTNGQGFVSATGSFTAPANAGTSTVEIKDAANQSVSVVFTLLKMGAPADGLSAINFSSSVTCTPNFQSNGTINGRSVCSQPSNLNSTTIVTHVHLTPENAHLANPTCEAGTQEIGSFTDCGGGLCLGNQKICATVSTVPDAGMAAGSYVKDIKVVGDEAFKVGGVGCPSGFQAVGSSADCFNTGFTNFCTGNIQVCVNK